MTTTRELLLEGLARQNAFQWSEAAELYQRVLRLQPNDGDALHLLGLLEHQQGRNELALPWIERAVRARPQTALFHSNHGTVLATLGRFDAAVFAFQKALAIDPNLPSVQFNLAVALQQAGHVRESIPHYQAALRLQPDAGAFNNLGLAFQKLGRPREAGEAFASALRLDSMFPDALVNMGHALLSAGQTEEALACFLRRASLPDAPAELICQTANAFVECGQLEAAVALYRETLKHAPQAILCNSLGALLGRLGQFEESGRWLRQAVALDPELVSAHNNLGLWLLNQGRFAEALAEFDRALARDPTCAQARYNRSLVLLTLGDFPRAWHEYEARHYFPGTNSPLPAYSVPRWDGANLSGRTILLQAEQGLGDTLQFARYVPLLAGRGATVLLVCPPSLHGILKSLPGLGRLLGPSDALPPFDYFASLMGMPAVFGTTLERIPGDVPYLHPPAAATPLFYDGQCRGLKVGFVWAGSPRHPKDRLRSVPLESFFPLMEVSGVRFVSLQAGPAASQLSSLPGRFQVLDVGSRVVDFVETAQAILQLDLVISIDTAVAHLAGALGKPVWLLLPHPPDWRWLLERPDTPWYPTMHLYRQPRFGEWAPVFQRVRQDLETLARAGTTNSPSL